MVERDTAFKESTASMQFMGTFMPIYGKQYSLRRDSKEIKGIYFGTRGEGYNFAAYDIVETGKTRFGKVFVWKVGADSDGRCPVLMEPGKDPLIIILNDPEDMGGSEERFVRSLLERKGLVHIS